MVKIQVKSVAKLFQNTEQALWSDPGNQFTTGFTKEVVCTKEFWVMLLQFCGPGTNSRAFKWSITALYFASLQTPEGQCPADDEEYVDEDEEDRIRFKDQLMTIGLFCRHVADYSVPLLAQLVEERVGKLQDFLTQFQQSMDISSMNDLHSLYEDLHWLFLISGKI
jgi:hypothetical protein